MAQHISDFYTQVQAKDFARQFQFRVTEMANTNFGEDTFVYLQTGNLPGRAINNVQVPFMGLNFNVPGLKVIVLLFFVIKITTFVQF